MSKKYNDEDELPKALQKGKKKDKKGKNKKKKSKFKIIVIVLLLILALLVGYIYYYVNDKLNRMQKVDLSNQNLEISEDKTLKEYKNIALFGVDSRSMDYGAGNRSDTIVIASINNKTGKIKLISVYRDTYVKIEGHGLDKITHAYSYGEAPLAIKTLNTNLDLNIKDFVTVNFEAVAIAVDQLGGIKMKVTAEEAYEMNKFIPKTAKNVGKTSNTIPGAGTYTLDGVQAVTYARIRKISGGDYKRSERTREVINAMLKKLKKKSLSEIDAFANKVLPYIYSNIGMSDILSLIPNITKYEIDESIGWPYDTEGITLDAWYGVPITLKSNVKKLHKEVFDDEDYTVPDTVKEISKEIETKTGYTK